MSIIAPRVSFACCTALFAIGLTSCHVDPVAAFVVKSQFIALRVLNIGDMSPIAGATVIASLQPLEEISPFVGPDAGAIIPLKPTDLDGRTWVPLFFRPYFVEGFSGEIELTVSSDDASETLTLSANSSDSVAGENFRVEIVELFAVIPECFDPVFVVGTEGLRIDCYVSLIEICELSTGSIVLRAATRLGNPYVGTVNINQVPYGFFLDDTGRQDCYLTNECLMRFDEEFAVTVHISENSLRCISYCLNTQGDIEDCD